MDGIDKVGLAYGGERFVSNETTQRPAAAELVHVMLGASYLIQL